MGAEDNGERSGLPFKLFLLGFLLMFVGVVVLIIAAWLQGDASVSGGVVFIIGFVPVVLGVGPHAFFAVLIAAILTVLAFIVFLWMRKQAIR